MAQEVQPEHIKELTHTVEMAQQGYWMPLAVVCLLFSIIIVLLVAQWVGYKKQNNERHVESEKQIRLLTTIATELSTDKAYKEKELNRMSKEIHTNRCDIKEIMK